MTVWVATGLTALAMILAWPFPAWLTRARWPQRFPHAAITLWQATLSACILAAIGAGLTIAVVPLAATFPHGIHTLVKQVASGAGLRGLGPTQIAALAWALAVTAWLGYRCAHLARQISAARRRQRLLIDLTSSTDPDRPGWRILPHTTPVAYCIPGRNPRIVTTEGAIALLDADELAAVLAHEQAHARSRRHLVLLCFATVAAAFPRLAMAQRAHSAAAELIEMLADDTASTRHDRPVLARALIQLAHHRGTPPAATLGAHHQVLNRVQRLLTTPNSRRRWTPALVYTASLVILAGPTLALALPALPIAH